ncbi:hypothetical protein ES319_D06G049200v1 [Gossypium barbadense]|uniref:Uncharacterized protein n=1 Tax=Gossypium barbadense TaxID=3634 RepID=A0A5J5R187_GOSBA|nr:hypothetical protein ES319_D06G049200v1 [Gossypium barbadense]
MEMNNFENLNRRRQLILVEPFVECFCNLRLTFKRYEEYWGDPVTKTLHSSDMRWLCRLLVPLVIVEELACSC